jgi:D-tyrosyl-tRNA(Tyr) deacylase
MVIVLQRVASARVEVEGRLAAAIGRGVCLLVGIERGDSIEAVGALARKVSELRIFPDAEGRMNLDLGSVAGEVLAVSQFTLAGSLRKGRRPSFDGAEEPVRAEALFQELVAALRSFGLKVETGVFGAVMRVALVNDGPVTFVLESGGR